MAFKDDEHTGMFQNTTLNKHCAKLSKYIQSSLSEWLTLFVNPWKLTDWKAS